MTEYYFRQTGGDTFEVAKFVDDTPTDVYKQTLNEHHQVCDCPSYRQPCKHLRWLKEWVQLENRTGYMYDDSIPGFVETPYAGDLLSEYVKKEC